MVTKTHFVIVNLCSIFSCIVTSTDEHHRKQTRNINYHVKKALVSVDDIFGELISLTNETEVCNVRLADVTQNLNNACKKIKKVGISEVDISTNKGKFERTIRVDVKKDYGACVDSLVGHCSELYAEIWCTRVVLWKNNHYNHTTDDLAEEALFRDSLIAEKEQLSLKGKRGTRQLKRIAPRDITKPRTGYRIRKEYRTLTIEERQRYHTAVRELYKDNTFSCFARVHRKGIKLKGVHKGEAFLPWHRAFLALYEEALRQIDPTVSLPYWDSSIDYNMANPALSVIWDEHHLGCGIAEVSDGPFANFLTDDNPLKRNIGQGKGSLMKPHKIDEIFWFCRLGDIFRKLEGAHNGVHLWVGGTMKGSLSASDPVFYMHHAFIDYIWEKFRERQQSVDCGQINPANDYPMYDETSPKPTKPGHMPEANMDGMEFLLNRRGTENFWTENWYGYAERPSCSNNCSNSEEMFCDEDINMCVGIMGDDLGNETLTPARRRRQAYTFSTQLYASIETSFSAATDNSSICRTQPYFRSCPTPSPPSTDEEIASAMVNGRIPVPDKIAKLLKRLQRDREKMSKTPPESEPTFFKETGDVRNDCRTTDTAAYDLILAILRGKKTGKTKIKETFTA